VHLVGRGNQRAAGSGENSRRGGAKRPAMSGFLHYFLSTLDPMSNLGFSYAIPELMTSALPEWWLFIVLPFAFLVLPSVAVWLVYLFNPAAVRPPPPALPDEAAPLVSVVVAGRNESETIGQCIRGALLCGYPNLEVVFVDADTILQYGSVQHWLLPFRDPAVGAVAANIKVNNSPKTLLTRFQEIEYA